jgi:hypothetical protein
MNNRFVTALASPALAFGLFSFFPTQELCIRSLKSASGKTVSKFEPEYRKIQRSFEGSLKIYHQQQNADILSNLH